MSLHIKEEIEAVVELANREKLVKETNLKIVREFKTLFYRFNNRQASDSEIVDNLQEKMSSPELKSCIEQMKNFNGNPDDAV
jgi:DNA polymerase II large subunit